jgi:uncharacterized protein (DUF488 family)
MKLFTIGFTQCSAEDFFARLKKAGVKQVLDVRLKNDSQLAGFTKKADLEYFLKALGGIGYEHRTELAPTEAMLDSMKAGKGKWPAYEKKMRELLVSRKIEKTLTRAGVDGACLLCGEAKPDACHRRVVAEYLQSKWKGLEIVHL